MVRELNCKLIGLLAMPTKVIRRMLRILAHVVCRPMHLCLNMVAREQAPSAQFIQICAWLVSSLIYVLKEIRFARTTSVAKQANKVMKLGKLTPKWWID